MAIYRLPPSPFVGGRQPLDNRDLPPSIEAVEVNDPIPNRAPAILVAILIAWQPVPIPQQRQVFTPQAAEVEEKVPFSRPIILNNWQIDFSQPQISGKVPIVAEEAFIPYFRPQFSNNWQEDYQPQLPRKLPVDILAVPEDNPPFTSRTNLPTIISWWISSPPIIQPKLGVITEEAVVEKVLFRQYQPIQYLEYVREQQPTKLPPSILAVDVNDPPFGQRTWLSTILYAWQPGPPQPILPVKIPQEFVAPDNPPFGQRIWLSNILRAWEPPPPQPWMPKLSYIPPPTSDIIIWMWRRIA